MSARISHNTTISIPHSPKAFVIVAGVCALMVILAAVIAYLSERPDLSLLITYLSDVRVTPVWPQIGMFPTPAP
jgi:hypothetical protein